MIVLKLKDKIAGVCDRCGSVNVTRVQDVEEFDAKHVLLGTLTDYPLKIPLLCRKCALEVQSQASRETGKEGDNPPK